jgi:hypothetical protein
MMARLFVLAMLGAVLCLGSCATMTPETCQVADWRALGEVDGSAGSPLTKYEARAADCAKAGIQADFQAYSAGRDFGLQTFCQPAAGFRAGLSGYSYTGVCPASLEADFMFGYRDGATAYGVRQALSNAESAVSSARSERDQIEEKIRGIESDARKPGVSEADKAAARKRVDELRGDRRRIEDRIRDAEYDRGRAASDVDRVRYQIGMRWGNW